MQKYFQTGSIYNDSKYIIQKVNFLKGKCAIYYKVGDNSPCNPIWCSMQPFDRCN
jgi:hypothetical protein